MITMPALTWAHPGHTHKTMGVVETVHENHLQVKDTQGKSVTFTLDDKTRVRRGKTILKAADIKVGDRVVVVTTETKGKDGKAIVSVTEVQVGTATS
jgi:translation initiation factor IF-1